MGIKKYLLILFFLIWNINCTTVRTVYRDNRPHIIGYCQDVFNDAKAKTADDNTKIIIKANCLTEATKTEVELTKTHQFASFSIFFTLMVLSGGFFIIQR